MAVAKKKSKKAKGKRKKKRGLPPVLKAWKECRDQEKVKPFVKMSKSLRSKVERCVAIKMARKKK
jgi:hypothetical protein